MVTENELAVHLSQQAGAIVVALGGFIVIIFASIGLWAKNGIPKWLDTRIENEKANNAHEAEVKKVALQREILNNDMLLGLKESTKQQNETIAVLTSELKDTQAKIAVLRKDTTALTDTTETLKRQLEDANKLTIKLRQEIKQLTERLAASERENADLKQLLKDRESELEQLRTQTANLQLQITAVETSTSANGHGAQPLATTEEKPSG